MGELSGNLPDAAPGTSVSIFKFKRTGMTALLLETADFIREERRRGNDPVVLGFREDNRSLYIDIGGAE